MVGLVIFQFGSKHKTNARLWPAPNSHTTLRTLLNNCVKCAPPSLSLSLSLSLSSLSLSICIGQGKPVTHCIVKLKTEVAPFHAALASHRAIDCFACMCHPDRFLQDNALKHFQLEDVSQSVCRAYGNPMDNPSRFVPKTR